MTDQLGKTLTVYRGSAILLNIVIGAGLLTLPGLAVKEAGSDALYSWLICATAAAPLVAVFIILGRLHPNAGGVAFYAQLALGSFGRRCAAFLLIGAIIFGLPSIALTGGHYLASVFPGSPFLYALLLLLGSILPHMAGGDRAGKVMALLASGILIVMIFFIGVGFLSIKPSTGLPPALPMDWGRTLAPFAMLFFAFTGWEIGAGIAEEFIDPRRDYPVAMALSFIVVTFLYLAVAYVTSRNDLDGHWEAPFVIFVKPILGNLGAMGVAMIAAVIVFANLSGALWGVSRFVYSLGRDEILPKALAVTAGGKPLRAVGVTALVLIMILGFYGCGLISLDAMIGVAGQNFLILYGLAAVSLFLISSSLPVRVLAGIVITVVGGFLSLQGIKLLYPIGLIVLAGLADIWVSNVQYAAKKI
jgi:amino acid efflux transporter